jgi:hypothetical protein
MRRALLGVVIAVALAVSVSDATVFGIAAWKVTLAGAGLILFILGSERTGRSGHAS